MNQAILDDKFLSNHLLYKLLEQATDEEKLQLTRIVMNDRDKAPYSYTHPLHVDKLFDEITCSGGNSFANVCRGQGNSYLDMLDDVAKTILKKKPFTRYEQIEHYDKSECYDDHIQEFALQIYLKKIISSLAMT